MNIWSISNESTVYSTLLNVRGPRARYALWCLGIAIPYATKTNVSQPEAHINRQSSTSTKARWANARTIMAARRSAVTDTGRRYGRQQAEGPAL